MRTSKSVREKEELKFKKCKLRKKKMYLLKCLGKEIWNEWGFTKEEFVMFIGAAGCVLFPLMIRVILALFGI